MRKTDEGFVKESQSYLCLQTFTKDSSRSLSDEYSGQEFRDRNSDPPLSPGCVMDSPVTSVTLYE